MSDKIEPALSAFQWRTVTNEHGVWSVTPTPGVPNQAVWRIQVDESHAAKTIALANAALRDNDPRKITRDKLAVLRLLRDRVNEHNIESWHNIGILDDLIEALDSYLPPEG